MKYGQENDVFVYDYLAAVKNLQIDLAQMYVEEITKFKATALWDFNALFEARHNVIPMKWVTESEMDLNSLGGEFLSFEPHLEQSIPAIYKDTVTKIACLVTMEAYASIIDGMKRQASCMPLFMDLNLLVKSKPTSEHVVWYFEVSIVSVYSFLI
jgi:hypothetical protein